MTAPSDKWPPHLRRRWLQSRAIYERMQKKDREEALLIAREWDVVRGRLDSYGSGRVNPLIFEEEE